MNTLEISALDASIGGSAILRSVTLSVRPNTVFCLMGRNGVGKTSTLRAITGQLPADRGSIVFNGTPLKSMATEERARLGIGYVPQGREIFPQLTVEENLHIGAIAQGRDNREALEQVLELFPVLKDFLARKGGNLSGGQQQQLAIGRALLTRPSLLILDEPTEGIQPNIIDRIGDVIQTLRASGKMAILLVEQYLDFCKLLGDDFAILERGSVAASGSMKDLSETLVTEYLTV